MYLQINVKITKIKLTFQKIFNKIVLKQVISGIQDNKLGFRLQLGIWPTVNF